MSDGIIIASIPVSIVIIYTALQVMYNMYIPWFDSHLRVVRVSMFSTFFSAGMISQTCRSLYGKYCGRADVFTNTDMMIDDNIFDV